MSNPMSESMLENANVLAQEILMTPTELKQQQPISATASRSVQAARGALRAILDGDDHRLFVVVGPCSVHDPEAAMDYARRLREVADEVSDSMLLVMRVYFEKPRTTTGWKGLINDPYLDDSFKIEEGLKIARSLMHDIAELGLPVSTEALDPISPQYLDDLVAWSAIGARTTESQTHREMASGLSSVIGFKNGTDGSLDVALNALQSASQPHRFLGINQTGQVSVVHTRGNRYGHVVLRGGTAGPNFAGEHIRACESGLTKIGLPANIMVDCSHANSSKQPERQPHVAQDIIDQIQAGNESIVGLMLESNIESGRQDIPKDLSQLRYGVSVTDGCIDWDTTRATLTNVRTQLHNVLTSRERCQPKRRSA